MYLQSVILLYTVSCFSDHVGNKPPSEDFDQEYTNYTYEIGHFSLFFFQIFFTLFMGDFCKVNIFFYIAIINM